jgi:hypothetical protein
VAARKELVKPGVYSRIFGETGRVAEKKMARSLTSLALVVEKQAKINASSGAHTYGTPTPAFPGSGPARISGTLVRSITHSDVRFTMLGKMEILVGTGVGFYPPYGTGTKTPANKYGLYLETVWDYPFLGPAVKFANGVPRDLIFKRNFGAAWTTLTF